MIRHHPADATLISAAMGTLPLLHRQVVGVHLAQCAACGFMARLGTEIGAALLETSPPTDLRVDARARVLARLDDRPSPGGSATPPMLTPDTVERLVAGSAWRRVGLGIKVMPLAKRDATETRLDLVRVAPGVALPQHDHTGREITCVIRGAFADATGVYRRGDVAEGAAGLDHQPRALADDACLCLVATTGTLRPHGWVARLLQPLFGI